MKTKVAHPQGGNKMTAKRQKAKTLTGNAMTTSCSGSDIHLGGKKRTAGLSFRHTPLWKTLRPLVLVVLIMTFFPSCTTIEATGERHLSFIGRDQEVEMGKSSNRDIVATMGLYDDDELQAYVQRLGAQIAATTERPELPWTFQVIDDDAINAFAVPGGYVYLTRGILAHFENEAQLAGVLGHEIAHITAKHSVIRMSKSMVTQLGLGIATIAVPELREFASLLGQGMQLLFLKFSRDDETESDRLGIRYMANINKDPQQLLDVMKMLGQVSEASEGGRLPQWASTHPLPENRFDYIRSRIAQSPSRNYAPVERQTYLSFLDGMVYGDNPRNGIIRQSTFYHPDMEFQMDFADGWQIINQRGAVIGLSPQKDAVVQMTLAKGENPRQALRSFLGQRGITALRSSGHMLNGFTAANGQFRATTQQGKIQGLVMFIADGDRLYQLVGYTSRQKWGAYTEEIDIPFRSFERLQESRYRNVEPRHLQIVELSSAESLSDLHARYQVEIPLEELARLNQMESSAVLPEGSFAKIVRGSIP